MSLEKQSTVLPRLYSDLATWFHLLTAPEDYREEAGFYRRVIIENSRIPVKTILELGSGGGNNASHLKTHFTMTLSDISEDMLAISRGLNPECEHIQGDMRNLRLGRQFDAVFIHDAISYLTSETELALAIETAFIHCKPGGVALCAPDYIKETFSESTKTGGHDTGKRGLRYLDWTLDPDPDDTIYTSHMVYIMKDGQNVHYASDWHVFGLFPRDLWRRLMKEAGFVAVKSVDYAKCVDKPDRTPVFTGNRPK